MCTQGLGSGNAERMEAVTVTMNSTATQMPPPTAPRNAAADGVARQRSAARHLVRLGAAALTGGLMLLQPAPATAQASQGLTGSVTLYGWLPAVDADMTTTQGGFSDTAAFSAGDLIDDLDAAVFGTAELRQGRVGAVLDVVYTSLSNGQNRGGPFSTRVDGDLSLLLITTAASYRVYERGTAYAEILAGGRFNRADMGITTSRDAPVPTSRAAGINRVWFDPLVGIRLGADITERLAIRVLADIGGFGVGSELTYEAVAALSYAITPGVSAVLGFRYTAIDYDADRMKLDIKMYGPTLGLTIGF
jgi:hypothetical protein